ncbi:non-ribosomal peptide synthetase [Marichromatium gracile]|uniref:Non-ribosomal peptide synthetase n=1 Tax=Marichromatium gracile TaxID=1048 RepID=A0ABR5VI40_MARGR|nr:non-ribosomal peptide synthetase [Marichromatium gracile]KXX65254.1 non-ribosomal peptide synthetase [Marichromatium gracile]
MQATELMTELETLGVALWAEDGKLRFRAPSGVLTEERMAHLRAHRDDLLALLAEPATVEVDADPAQAHAPFGLTDVQTAYLLGRHDSFGYGGVACHGYLEVLYPRVEDPACFETAWNQLIARHPMLRAVIAPEGTQRVLETVAHYALRVDDLRALDTAARKHALAETRAALDHRLYETTRWPLFELRLSRTEAGEILHVSLDSLIADWASAGILFDELDRILAGEGEALPALEIGFRDYLVAERRMRESARYQRDRQYWMARVDALPPAPELTLRHDSGEGPARFARHHARLDATTWERLRARAAEHGTTATIPVLAAYAAVLQRWSRHQAFSLNLTLLNRLPLHPQVERLVGDFTSVSLLEIAPLDGRAFDDWAAAIGERLFADLDHRLFSGVEVLREITRRRGREAALMPVVFTSAIGLGRGEPPRSGRRTLRGLTQTPQVLLDCQVMDDHDGLEINWDVRQGVFPEGLVEDMFTAFTSLLRALATEPTRWRDQDPVALPEWQRQERRAANDTAAALPERLLHQAVFERAAEHPGARALIDARGTLDYATLTRAAGAVAETLRAAGCRPGERVAVVMEKGREQVVAVLGALLAGAVYVPIDITQPALRRARIIERAGVRLVLTQSWLALDSGCTEIAVDTLTPAAEVPVCPAGDPDALAYVIHTSGSTGEPKGVMISHRAACNTIDDINRRFGVDAGARVLGLAQLGFDLSVYDLFGTLGLGATLVLPDPARGADPSHWAELIARHALTLWNSVPAQLQMLAGYLESEPRALPSLRLALLSGDWIPITLPEQLARLLPDLALVSLGGATEAAIWSNYHRITRVDPDWTSIPYGRPLANQGLRVLDAELRDVPVWTRGELYLGGAGLAQGYLGDAELTAARFITHPRDGQRLYRTGDLARYRPGGEVEFLGREDGQVKLRGHRIELGEVESALLAHPDVGAAAAVISDPGAGERALLGFVECATVERPPEDDPEPLRRAVARFAERQCAPPPRLDEASAELEAAARQSMLAALAARWLFADTESWHAFDEILERAAIAPRHHWLTRRWLDLLERGGWLERARDAERYRLARPFCAAAAPAAWTRLREHHGAVFSTAFIDYHLAHVERLQALLEDRADPFALLFPEGRQETALAIYRDDLAARYNNQAAAALINRVVTGHDERHPLRILELGAGTGATTAEVLALLEGYPVDYLFTDISPFFLGEARRRWGERAGMRFARFDLDGDLRAQGLAPNGADLILCAGMLNSVADPERALDAIVELLAPGGWLVFTEPTEELAHVMLTQGFMMSPRDDGAGRFLSRERWRALIESRGGALAVELPEAAHPLACRGMAVFAARFKRERRALDLDDLAATLAQRLPAPMRPAHLQILDHLPLSATGKIDRKRLAGLRPAPLADGDERAASDARAPDPLETELCAIWADALGIERITPEENVYDRGADSLILARVAGRLREEVDAAAPFAYDTLLRQMLNEPTVAALAAALRASPEAEPAAAPVAQPDRAAASAESNARLVSFGGGDTGPLRVMFHAALGTLDYFQHLGRGLAAQRLGPVVGIAVADVERYLAIDTPALIETVAADYAVRLRATGHTRFQLVGYCLGGLLATETARRLFEQGLEVVDLTLVDSIPMFIDTDEELAFEAIFVPNLNLDPVAAVFGEQVEPEQLHRAIAQLTDNPERRVPAGAMAALSGDPGLEAVAAAVRAREAIDQETRLAGYASAAAAQAGLPVGPELVPALFRVCRHSMRAARFDPPPYVGDMTFLRCREQQSFGIAAGVGHLAAPFWQEVCLGEFRLIDVAGNHFSVIEPPHVEQVLAHLGAALGAQQ